MCPKNAEIFLAEDDEEMNRDIVDVVTGGGHVVIYNATDFETALSNVEKLEPGQIDAAVLDGNLDQQTHTGEHGRILAEKIRAVDPNIPIIGISNNEAPWATVDLRKINFDKLSKVLTDIPSH